ncbi:MAG: class I poly(R)-hydroxyalkanoic acid synthase [Pseudomonadota bacterium]
MANTGPVDSGKATDRFGDGSVDAWVEETQTFAANMARVAEMSQEIWRRFLSTQLADEATLRSDPLNTLPAFTEFAQSALQNPERIAEATMAYWQAQGMIWQQMTNRMLGIENGAAPVVDASRDKRFRHREWSENALFDYLRQSYLVTADYLEGAATTMGDLDARDRRKIAFLTRNFVEAMSPSNFFALNPEVLERTMEEKGENLVRGLNMMLEDLDRGKGRLIIRQTDMEAFAVGEDMAVTPGEVIWQNDILQLIQYSPTTEKVHQRPLLVMPPWINKYYVLDLNEQKSMMRWLVAQGYTVFMISWVNPDERHARHTWESYMSEGASAAIDKVLEETGQKSLNLAAYCIGGTLAGVLAAYLCRIGDKRVNSATFFTAQLDFEDAGDLQVFVDDQTIDLVDEQMEKGYLPAEAMAQAFNMLRASDLIWGYVVSNYLLGKDPFPFDLLYWNADSTAMPARVHHFYLDTFYNQNALAKEELELLGQPIRLSDITVDCYHVATKEDHIAPAASVYRGARLMTNAETRFVLAGSGHIAGVVNPPEAEKYQHWVNEDLSPSTVGEWLQKAEERPGSWWPDWSAWLAKRSGRKVNARTAGAKLGTIEPAPGAYVKVRFDKR